MKDISVIIPTCKRAHFLPTTLRSVASQTIVDRIGEVLVIENGSDRASEEVCKQFPNLPIKYIFRNPSVPVSGVTVGYLSEPSLPYVALLHDDDWWLNFHLQRSVEELDRRPQLSAVYSSNYYAGAKNLWLSGINGNFPAWFANDESMDGQTRLMDFTQVLISSILQSGLHMSTLVMRKSAIQPCFAAFEDGNAFDHDRTLAVELARQGDILFHDIPSVVVRIHPGQDGCLAIQDGRAHWFLINTRRLIQQAIDSSIDIPAELAKRVSRSGFGPKPLFKHVDALHFEPLHERGLLPAAVDSEYSYQKKRLRFAKMAALVKGWLQIE